MMCVLPSLVVQPVWIPRRVIMLVDCHIIINNINVLVTCQLGKVVDTILHRLCHRRSLHHLE